MADEAVRVVQENQTGAGAFYAWCPGKDPKVRIFLVSGDTCREVTGEVNIFVDADDPTSGRHPDTADIPVAVHRQGRNDFDVWAKATDSRWSAWHKFA